MDNYLYDRTDEVLRTLVVAQKYADEALDIKAHEAMCCTQLSRELFSVIGTMRGLITLACRDIDFILDAIPTHCRPDDEVDQFIQEDE